jgi:uncharacterized membrane protein YgcG
MKGLIRKAALYVGCAVGAAGIGCATTSSSCSTCGCGAGAGGLGLGGAQPASANCCKNKDLYDHCWPERYNNLAQREVNLAFTPQVQNGHVLDQTIWNWHFEKGTDKLTPGGMAQLQYIARRRPQPDCTVYMATALDLAYDPCCPDRYCGANQELNALRVAAIQKYLVALNCGRPMDFQVLVHDPADVTINSGNQPGINPVTNGLNLMNAAFRGSISSGGGGGAGGTAGPTGGGTSGGGGGGGATGGR